MARRKKRFTYAFSKKQIQLTIEALLIARSAGAHAEVVVTEESGKEHRFRGIVSDGSIDNLVDKLESDGVDYEIQLNATGDPYSRAEDKSLEQTINALNDSLGEIEEAEAQEAERVASEATPELIEELYKMLETGEK